MIQQQGRGASCRNLGGDRAGRGTGPDRDHLDGPLRSARTPWGGWLPGSTPLRPAARPAADAQPPAPRTRPGSGGASWVRQRHGRRVWGDGVGPTAQARPPGPTPTRTRQPPSPEIGPGRRGGGAGSLDSPATRPAGSSPEPRPRADGRPPSPRDPAAGGSGLPGSVPAHPRPPRPLGPPPASSRPPPHSANPTLPASRTTSSAPALGPAQSAPAPGPAAASPPTLGPRPPPLLGAPARPHVPPRPPLSPPPAPTPAVADPGRPGCRFSPRLGPRAPRPRRHPPKVRRCLKVFSDGMARAARRRVPEAADGGGGERRPDCGDSDFPCVSSARSRVR